MDPETKGLTLLCITCTTPFLTGALLAWIIRGRLEAGGWMALLPRFIRNLFED